MTVNPAWGLAHVVPEDAIAAWGARLIVTQDGDTDLLGDRQGGSGPEADDLYDLLDKRFPLPVLRRAVSDLLASYEMRTREAEDFILYLDDRLVVHANTNASAGYCYVTAWLYEKKEG